LRRNAATVLVLALCAAATAFAAARTISRKTSHLTFTAALSPDVVAPGTRMTLTVDVVPKKGLHVYAPGTEYRPIGIALDPNPALQASEPVYPKPAVYLFKPLNEDVLVYSEPFRLRMDVVVGSIAPRASRLRITGKVVYQACDDRSCFLPQSVPIEWTLKVASRSAR
jgi:DsbC/DsbD-like thiol-disulfide interchange protein